MSDDLNPRFVIWAEHHGHDPVVLLQKEHWNSTPTRIPVPDDPSKAIPWTILFMGWVTEKWREFGALPQNKDTPHSYLVLYANRDGTFNDWLKKEYPSKA